MLDIENYIMYNSNEHLVQNKKLCTYAQIKLVFKFEAYNSFYEKSYSSPFWKFGEDSNPIFHFMDVHHIDIYLC